MQPLTVKILGCGSALPTRRHNPSCQVVEIGGKSYMLDCGEGAQIQMRRMHISQQHIRAIFISHLHGDHCFGLLGLLSSMSLQGRTAPIDIYGPLPLVNIFQPQIDFFGAGAKFDIRLHQIPHSFSEVIYEDNSISVRSVPLQHRMPCVGYLIKENAHLPHIRRDMIDFHSIPHYAIMEIKQGAAWQTPDGKIIPHERLVLPAEPERSYAYISDTLCNPDILENIREVNLLYHEATFSDADAHRAVSVMHSTASQAAAIARDANAKRLVLGHFSARYDDENFLLQEARKIFPNTLLAEEGLCLNV